jgi:hypothetical protein
MFAEQVKWLKNDPFATDIVFTRSVRTGIFYFGSICDRETADQPHKKLA